MINNRLLQVEAVKFIMSDFWTCSEAIQYTVLKPDVEKLFSIWKGKTAGKYISAASLKMVTGQLGGNKTNERIKKAKLSQSGQCNTMQ